MIDFLHENDAKECIAMMSEFYSSSAVLHGVPQEFIENTVKQALSGSPYIKVIIYKSAGEYAGYCNLSFTYSGEVGGKVALIEEVFVRDKFRGKGIGTALLNFVRDKYDSDVKRYRLEVVQNNEKAIKLYCALGFEMLDYKQMILDM